MDEGTAELLSRYLDGDLDAAETRLIEARLAAEPDLRAELTALRRLQLHVRSVADRMMPPQPLLSFSASRMSAPMARRAPRQVMPGARRANSSRWRISQPERKPLSWRLPSPCVCSQRR